MRAITGCEIVMRAITGCEIVMRAIAALGVGWGGGVGQRQLGQCQLGHRLWDEVGCVLGVVLGVIRKVFLNVLVAGYRAVDVAS
jgi:hypothetical protein